MEVRVRFAPSPSGSLHVGGARTALFNWLFARHHNGRLILRVDDTDQARSSAASLEQILDSLNWLGLNWDEGPYFQSRRLKRYREAVDRLLDEGKAYYCFCSTEELALERQKALDQGKNLTYSGRCRKLSAAEAARRLAEGRRAAVRLKVPGQGKTVVEDLIRGRVEVDNSTLDDFVILKSDGTPVYHLASVVDDGDYGITQVIRAEEHLPNTPKQILLFEALGFETPQFAHVPMILAPDRSKLSKRHGATSVTEFKDQGILPQTMLNYLALLGWSPGRGQEELFSLEELVQRFSLEQINKTAAVYDVNKLVWLNGRYMRELNPENLAELAKPFFVKAGLLHEPVAGADSAKLKQVVLLLQNRAKTFREMAEAADCFFNSDFDYQPEAAAKLFQGRATAELLAQTARELAELERFDAENTEAACRRLAKALQIKFGDLVHPVRLALTGKSESPGLFEVMVVLGQEETVRRLKRASLYCLTLEKGQYKIPGRSP